MPSLLEALQDPDSKVKGRVSEILGEIGDPATIPDLLQVLHDPGEGPTLKDKQQAQYSATKALGKIGDPVAIDDILQTMAWVFDRWERGSDEPVISALATLASRGSAGISRLLQAQGDSNERTRRLATSALERMGVK